MQVVTPLVMPEMSAAMLVHHNSWMAGLQEPGKAETIPGPAALLAPGSTP